MVSIYQKDLFLTKSGLQRIDQLLGMKSKDYLCLVQSEDNLVLFEVWNMLQERIVLYKKIYLYNYELSSNVITLESNQLAFYGVMEETGVQCLFLVDIFEDQVEQIKQDEIQRNKNEIVMKIMVEEQNLNDPNSQESNKNKSYTENADTYALYRKDTAVSLNPYLTKKSDDNAIELLNNYKQCNFKNSTQKNKNNNLFEIDILDVDSDGNIGLKEEIQSIKQSQIKEFQNVKQEKANSFDEDGTLQSFPANDDKNLPLFLEPQTEKQEISFMNSFITQDFQQGASNMNDILNIIDDINCINNFENQNINRNEMFNYKDYLPADQKPINQDRVIREESHLSLQDNYSLTNSNIKNHTKLKEFANDYQQSISGDNYNNNNENKKNNNNNYNGIKSQRLFDNVKEKNIFQSNEYSKKDNFSGSGSNGQNETNSISQSGIEQNYKYLADSKEICCIYEINQRELFSKCVQFFSEILGQGYHGIIIVKNTYYMVNYDDSYYMLLVLSIYRTGNTQQFAQYILRKDVDNLDNQVQIICVQNTHKIIIYDPLIDELIIWTYFGDTLTPDYYTFQQFQSLHIKYAFQNSNNPTLFHFIYKDHQSNLYKILSYDFKSGNNITKGFPNKEMSKLRSPIIIKQQEAYVIKHAKENMLVICTIYKNNELTTYWNVYELNCVTKSDHKGVEGLLSQIHTHLESSETDNNDIKTHFVPNFSLVSPNIYFFNTSDIHSDVQSAINTFIHNKDIHFKAIQILKE